MFKIFTLQYMNNIIRKFSMNELINIKIKYILYQVTQAFPT